MEDQEDVLFRGQGSAGWGLTSTLERAAPRLPLRDYYRLVYSLRAEIESATNTHWDIRRVAVAQDYISEREALGGLLMGGKLPALEFLGYLRHNGFPSPL